MPRSPLLTIRVPDETRARWQALADERGLSLSALVKHAVETLGEREPRAEGGRTRSAPAPPTAVEAPSRSPSVAFRVTVTPDWKKGR